MDLQAIRDYVRNHMELEQDDLPDPLLDTFIREGARKVESSEQRWPFYEAMFDVTVGSAGETTLAAISPLLKRISGIRTPSGFFLKWLTLEDAQLRFSSTSSSTEPTHYSTYGSQVFLFPAPSTDTVFKVLGYRRQEDWVSAGSGEEPDMPVELHNTVALWALHRAYAQQEDLEQSALYERLFSAELNELGRRICEMPLDRPLQMNSEPSRRPAQQYTFQW